MKNRKLQSPHKNKQEGSVLLISLMLLIVMTMLTFAVSESVLNQGKMTANTRDDLLAFEVAESAIKEAELNVVNFTYAADGGLSGHYDGNCDEDDSDCYITDLGDLFDENTWVKSTTTTRSLSCGNGDATCLLRGQYIVIRMGTVDVTISGANTVQSITNQYQDQAEGAVGDVYKYKVIGRGSGINPKNKRIIVSYFAAAEL